MLFINLVAVVVSLHSSTAHGQLRAAHHGEGALQARHTAAQPPDPSASPRLSRRAAKPLFPAERLSTRAGRGRKPAKPEPEPDSNWEALPFHSSSEDIAPKPETKPKVEGTWGVMPFQSSDEDIGKKPEANLRTLNKAIKKEHKVQAGLHKQDPSKHAHPKEGSQEMLNRVQDHLRKEPRMFGHFINVGNEFHGLRGKGMTTFKAHANRVMQMVQPLHAKDMAMRHTANTRLMEAAENMGRAHGLGTRTGASRGQKVVGQAATAAYHSAGFDVRTGRVKVSDKSAWSEKYINAYNTARHI